MLIILEGVDCSGKSTLARAIARQLYAQPHTSIEMFHRGPPKSSIVEEYMLPLGHYKPNTGHHIICDRWHWGEAVYPEVLDRKSEMTAELFSMIEHFLLSIGAIVILLDPSHNDLVERMNTRGDDYINTRQISRIRTQYIRVFARTTVSAARFNVNIPTAEQVIELAKNAEKLRGMESA